MNTNRRHEARRASALQVNIRYRKRRLQYAYVRNLSINGMYLDVRSITLPKGTLVEIELDSAGEEMLVPAVVVHQNGSGIGVEFRDPQPELLEVLCHLNRTHYPEARSQFQATTQAHPT